MRNMVKINGIKQVLGKQEALTKMPSYFSIFKFVFLKNGKQVFFKC